MAHSQVFRLGIIFLSFFGVLMLEGSESFPLTISGNYKTMNAQLAWKSSLVRHMGTGRHHPSPSDADRVSDSDSSDGDAARSIASQGRRQALMTGFAGWMSSTTTTTAAEAAATDQADLLFVRKGEKKGSFAYQFQPPASFGTNTPTNKPLKTHLDEVNFISPINGKYQFGITVDPVRIQSLQQFGTPEEVAAKVVLAEVNRDGVFDVTLMEDPAVVVVDTGGEASSSTTTTAYQLNYLSVGKRGKKRFVALFTIFDQKLYALTAQCSQDDYDDLKQELLTAVQSFRVLAS